MLSLLPGYRISSQAQCNVILAETIIVGLVPDAYTEVYGGTDDLVGMIQDYGALVGVKFIPKEIPGIYCICGGKVAIIYRLNWGGVQMSEDIRRKMRELEKQVEHHMHLYYDLDAPELEDYEYDRLIHSLMDLEEQYPQYASPNSPTKRVGGKAQETPSGRSRTKCRWARCRMYFLPMSCVPLTRG